MSQNQDQDQDTNPQGQDKTLANIRANFIGCVQTFTLTIYVTMTIIMTQYPNSGI